MNNCVSVPKLKFPKVKLPKLVKYDDYYNNDYGNAYNYAPSTYGKYNRIFISSS